MDEWWFLNTEVACLHYFSYDVYAATILTKNRVGSCPGMMTALNLGEVGQILGASTIHWPFPTTITFLAGLPCSTAI